MIPLSGFLPDADEHSEGVITDCSMMLPTVRGYKAAPSLATVSDPLASSCRGAIYAILLDNTTRTIAGTQTNIYEFTNPGWASKSRGGGYTGTAESVWRFLQFGNVTIAMNKTDATQYSNYSGAFADLSGAPKALVGDVVDGYVMVANYDDGTDTADGIYWSGYQDYTDWTPSITTGCGNLRVYDTPGDIRGLRRLGANAVVYKENSMYLGVNSYSSALWGFNLIADDIGAVSQEAIVSTGAAHYFLGNNDFWFYDGSGRPQSIGAGVKEYFFNDCNNEFVYRVRGAYDRNNQCIYWYYPTGSTLDSCIVYHLKTGKWGKANRNVEATVEVLVGSLTYGQLAADYATYADIPTITYGSPFWFESAYSTAVFNSAHSMATLTGTASSSSITTGAVGDDTQLTLIQRVQPRMTDDPTSATMTNYYRMTDGAAYTTDTTTTMTNARFDVLRAARWHKFKMDFTGDCEITGINYKLAPAGEE